MAVVEPALARSPMPAPIRLEPGTVPRGTLWVEGVNAVTSDLDLQIIRESGPRLAVRSIGMDSGSKDIQGVRPRIIQGVRPRIKFFLANRQRVC